MTAYEAREQAQAASELVLTLLTSTKAITPLLLDTMLAKTIRGRRVLQWVISLGGKIKAIKPLLLDTAQVDLRRAQAPLL
tara:strand:+ start:112 stop:351 length:240 start_codon:yes stop_codon:yes gene_type:complete